MNKKKIKILAIAVIVVVIALVVVYLFTSYRGSDGLTFKESRMLMKYGASKITKEELEEAIDLDKYNETIAFYESDPTFGEKIKYAFGNNSKSEDKASDKADKNNGNDKSESDSDKGESSSGNDSSSNSSGSSSDGNSGNSSSGGSSSDSGSMTYEKYISMSPEDQQKYFESYSSPEAFFKWFNAAKAEYDKNNDSVEVEGGNIDIGDYMDEE